MPTLSDILVLAGLLVGGGLLSWTIISIIMGHSPTKDDRCRGGHDF